MKKILIFSLSYYPSDIGGAEIAIKEITDRIDPSEIAFHLICNRFDTSLPTIETVGNVTVHRIGFGKRGADSVTTHRPLFYLAKVLFVPLAALKGFSLHRRHRFDGLWAMMVYMTIPITLVRALGMRLPYIVTLQEGDPFERIFTRWRIRTFLPLIRYGIQRAAMVQAISSYLAEWPKRVGFEGRVEIIPNGVDVVHFSQTFSKEILAKTRAELLHGKEEIALVHVGRMVLKNGLEDVIRALARLSSNISFVQIGAGPDKAKLMQLATACGVADRVHFLGFIDHTELPRYLGAADIFIRPSLSEGMGNAFVEAMAAGVPVIGTQEGGIADFLFDPRDQANNPDKSPTGRAVKQNDPEGIARAVMLYLTEPDMTKRIVENARKLATEKYDWAHIVRAMRIRVFSHIPDA